MPENTDDNRRITILLVNIGAVIFFSMARDDGVRITDGRKV